MNSIGWWLLWATVATVLAWQWRGALREPRMPDTAPAEVDDLELLYDLPAYDPAWDAGCERLWDAIRDEQQKGD